MTVTALARRTTICILGALALWNSWECRALYSDGAIFLVQVVRNGGLTDYGVWARQYAIGITQIPLVIGLGLGVTDLQWLSRLLSLGVFGLPTILYQLALMRAGDDAAVLAAVLAAIALTFMTTSFFIVGEYNTAYAVTVAAASWLATTERPRLIDGIVLVALALLALRTYEAFIYLGPLLAAMIVWGLPRDLSRSSRPADDSFVQRLVLMGLPVVVTIVAFQGLYLILMLGGAVLVASILVSRHPRARPENTTVALHLFAAALFLAGAIVAAHSSSGVGTTHFRESVFSFWRNVQFDLVLAAALAIFIWWIARPRDLGTNRPFVWAGLPLAVLAAMPMFSDMLAPINGQHWMARTAGGFVVGIIVCCLWARRGSLVSLSRLFGILGNPQAARRCLVFFFVMFLAGLPAELSATAGWNSFLETVRTTVRAREGGRPYEHLLPAIDRYYWLEEDTDSVPDLNFVLRSRPDDGNPGSPPAPNRGRPRDTTKFVWRD